MVGASWRQAALCRGRTDDWQAVSRGRRSVTLARVVCLACPVYTECRRWVLSWDQDPCPWHVVAAMTPRERLGALRYPAVFHV